jgi:hypothetical protein
MNVDGVFQAVKQKWRTGRLWLAVSHSLDVAQARNDKQTRVSKGARIDRLGV